MNRRRYDGRRDFLKDYRLVRNWACRDYGISEPDLEILMHLDPLIYFTIKDFDEGLSVKYNWENKRFYRLQNEGWIEKIAGREDNGHKGHNRYKVSLKGKLMISRIYKIILEEEDFPEKAIRNNPKTKLDRDINRALNKLKNKNYGKEN